MEVRAFDLIETDLGRLTSAEFDKGAWLLTFSKGLRIECDAGWRLVDEDGGKKLVLGSRDEELSLVQKGALVRELADYRCKTICFKIYSDVFELAFFHKSEDMSLPLKHLELISNSAKAENWRLIGDDFVDSDKLNMIRNLTGKADGQS